MPTTNLSSVQPDFQQIKDQLNTQLAAKDTWKDLILSSTGAHLTDIMAQIGEIDQFAIEQQLKQGFIDTALTDSAVLAAARTLGVRLIRKQPAQIDVRMTPTGTVTIPPYSQFSVNGVTLFNRTAVTLSAPTTITLYEGTLVTKTVVSDGTDFQLFRTDEGGFIVSDVDTTAISENVQIPVVQEGLWNYPLTSAISDATTFDGQLILTFGSDKYGFRPGAGIEVTISYIICSGVEASNAALTAQQVTPLGSLAVTGESTSGIYGGGSEWSVETMRRISPLLFAARNRATTEAEHSATAVQYPGVLDAAIWGQHRIAPADVRYMNAAQISLLTETPFNTAQYTAFEAWFRQRTMYPLRYFFKQPTEVLLDITARVYCKPQADLTQVQSAIETKLVELLAPRFGTIGRNIYKHDIHRAIIRADANVEYVELEAPAVDLVIDVKSPVTNVTTSTGGTLVPGSFYSYGVSVVTTAGESLVTSYASVLMPTARTRVTLAWDPVQTAVTYNVYGRGPTSYGLLQSGITGTTFIDNGSLTPSGTLPRINNSGTHYVALGTVSLTMKYTDRD